MTTDLNVGMKCIKYMLFVTNFMFVMIGVLLISIGTTIRTIYSDFEIFMESHYFSPAALLVVIGIIIFFVATFGCVGAMKGSTCLINLYAVLLFFILIMEISTAIAAYTMRKDISEKVGYNMEMVLSDYDENSDSIATQAMDFLQARLQCCGVNSYQDWGLDAFQNDSTIAYWKGPESCCYNSNCIYIYEQGCLSRLTYVVSQCAILLASGVLCVAFVQLLGVVFAHMLAKAVRRIKTEIEMENQASRHRFYAELVAEKENKDKLSSTLYSSSDA